MTIDTHVHFYDPGRPEAVPWPRSDSPLYRPVLPGEWGSLADSCGVTGTIVVEASEWIDDNNWILRLASAEPRILGVVGRLNFTDPGFEADLERFAADPLFRGVRLNGGDVAATLRKPSFRANLSDLARRRLVLELNVGPALLDHVLEVAETTPDLMIVLDHMAGADQADGRPSSELLNRLRRISARAKLACKLSGFVEAASKHHDPVPVNPAYYRPMFDALFEAMGPERLLYASNWPVSDLMVPYVTLCRILNEWIGAQSTSTSALIRSDNAITAYRLQA